MTLVLLLAGAAVYVLHARAWAFVCDDAFISFRYAQNLAAHGQLHFNPGEAVEGFTNPLWVLVLAGLARLGLPPHVAAPELTWAAGALTLGLAFELLALLSRPRGETAVRRRGPALAIPVALLVASPEFMVWTHGGLETMAATALTLAAMVAWLHRRWSMAAAMAGLAWLARPDTAIPIAGFGLAWLVAYGIPYVRARGLAGVRALPWRGLALALLVFAVPVLGYLLFRRAYFGAWLPNTWAVKAYGHLLRATWGQAYLVAWLEAVHAMATVPLVVLVRTRHLVLVVPIALVLAYGYAVGGDFMAYGRFYLTATVLFAVLVGWLLGDLSRILARTRFAYPKTVALVLGLFGALVLGMDARERWRDDRATGAGWLEKRWEGVTAMDRFARVGLAAGERMRRMLPPETVITVGAAGAVPYASGLRAIDAYGLVEPNVARLEGAGPLPRGRPGHQLQAPPEYIRSRDPDLLCHVGHRGASRPRAQAVHPAFRRDHVWACFDVGTVPATVSGLAFEGGVYCCLRPNDRVVGPFR